MVRRYNLMSHNWKWLSLHWEPWSCICSSSGIGTHTMWRKKRKLVLSSFGMKSYSAGSAFRQQTHLPVGILHREQKSLLRPLPDYWQSWMWWEMEWEFNTQYCFGWSSNTLPTWCEELTQWKRPWCWERLKAEGEGNIRGWGGWMASLTQWTWVWARPSL